MEKRLAHPPIREHETFMFIAHRWDVTAAWNMIEAGREVHELDVVHYYNSWLKDNDAHTFNIMAIHIDPEYALSDAVDPDIPVIIAETYSSPTIPPENDETFLMVIDGNNRIYKAYHQGRKKIAAYHLTADETRLIEHNLHEAYLVTLVPSHYKGTCPECHTTFTLDHKPDDYHHDCPRCGATHKYVFRDEDEDDQTD